MSNKHLELSESGEWTKVANKDKKVDEITQRKQTKPGRLNLMKGTFKNNQRKRNQKNIQRTIIHGENTNTDYPTII